MIADNLKERGSAAVATDRPTSDLSSLNLVQLREYRATLSAEEDKVSYWRRVAHARIDSLETDVRNSNVLTLDDLVRVLGNTGSGVNRRGLGKASATLPLPELPKVSDMWTSEVDPDDGEAVRSAVDRLEGVESQLSGYRYVLHGRIEQATGELIQRYRRDPHSALSAIPPD